MALSDLTSRDAVLAAIQEFDDLGRDAFLDRYHFGAAHKLYVLHNGKFYDSKAIVGAAYAMQYPERGPLLIEEFSGGEPTTRKLTDLGFMVIDTTSEDASDGRIFGEIPGVPPGATFPSRETLAESGVHKPMQAGISASEREGADSIVVSGGYEDDEDLGTVIIYTGAGGNDPQTKKQIADQVLRRGNLGLARSCDEGLPVRVVRGSGGDPEHSPPTGFRYDGLFRVERYWEETGRSGFKIWRFRLVKEEVDSLGDEDVSESGEPARRVESTVQRLVRNTAVTRWVKDLYDHRCQVCGVRVLTLSGPYAEGAHIKALGRPHSGPDAKSNVLCLCPTDHVRFDGGGIVVDDELNVIDQSSGEVVGPLHVHPKHQLEMEMLRYHREQFERD